MTLHRTRLSLQRGLARFGQGKNREHTTCPPQRQASLKPEPGVLIAPVVILLLLAAALVGLGRLAFRDVSHFYTAAVPVCGRAYQRRVVAALESA